MLDHLTQVYQVLATPPVHIGHGLLQKKIEISTGSIELLQMWTLFDVERFPKGLA